MLEDDECSPTQTRLLPLDVDVEIRISLQQIVEYHPLETTDRVSHGTVDLRSMDRQVSKEYEDIGASGHGHIASR